jgi:hypothetical protein
MAARMPASRPSGAPSGAVAAFITWLATTEARPMVKPTERSMPPEMMTKVWPIASSSGAVAATAIELRL